MNKYCSVGASLKAELSYEVELLHEHRSTDELAREAAKEVDE